MQIKLALTTSYYFFRYRVINIKCNLFCVFLRAARILCLPCSSPTLSNTYFHPMLLRSIDDPVSSRPPISSCPAFRNWPVDQKSGFCSRAGPGCWEANTNALVSRVAVVMPTVVSILAQEWCSGRCGGWSGATGAMNRRVWCRETGNTHVTLSIAV